MRSSRNGASDSPMSESDAEFCTPEDYRRKAETASPCASTSLRISPCPPYTQFFISSHMSPLSDIEIQRALGTLPGWTRRGETLSKTYHFATFPDAIAFIGRVAEVAESMNHHPDIDIRYTKLHFHLSSHDVKGITSRDLKLAQAIEALVTPEDSGPQVG